MKLSNKQKKTRFLMMVFGIFITFFAGYPHIWSIYQPYAIELTGWSQSQASMCFYLALSTFVFGSIWGGRLQDKYTPRLAIMIGGGLLTAGILLASFSMRESPVYAYLTYGVMQGIGQGMIYTTVVSTAQKWFPEKSGFASGMIVMADALCGFFLAPISKFLLEKHGIKATFLFVSGMIAIAWILGCTFVKSPQHSKDCPEEQEEIKETVYQYTSMEMMKTKKFYYLFATMLFGLVSYLMVSPLSQTIQLENGIPASVAVGAVMFGSICNAATRLVLPSISDKIGRIPCIKVVLIVQIIAMFLLIAASSYILTVAVILIYACYGGIMGSFPSLTSSVFGMKHSGENYGYVMFGLVIATLGIPVITNLVTVKGHDVNVVFATGALCAVLSFVCLHRLKSKLDTKGV